MFYVFVFFLYLFLILGENVGYGSGIVDLLSCCMHVCLNGWFVFYFANFIGVLLLVKQSI